MALTCSAKSKMRRIDTIRRISISQSSISRCNQKQSDPKLSAINAEKLPSGVLESDPKATILGETNSLLSLNVPPSVPVSLRYGSLISIYDVGSNELSSIKISHEYIQPLQRLFYGFYSFSYQKLMSTTPFSILVSPNSRASIFKKSLNRGFAEISLDGSSDWAIFKKSALQATIGNNINVRTVRTPVRISRKLAKDLQIPTNRKTGMSSFTSLGHLFVTGRGRVALSGTPNLYTVELNDSEQILLNKRNLVAISVNGPYDIRNCVWEHVSSFESKKTEPLSNAEQNHPYQKKSSNLYSQEPKILTKSDMRYYAYILKNFWKRVNKIFSFGRQSISFEKNKDFVHVIGPRTLLLQPYSDNGSTLQLADFPVPTMLEAKEKLTPSNTYLSYVTMSPKREAVFESTSNFKDTVEKIEASKK